jgi:hypothetical protein
MAENRMNSAPTSNLNSTCERLERNTDISLMASITPNFITDQYGRNSELPSIALAEVSLNDFQGYLRNGLWDMCKSLFMALRKQFSMRLKVGTAPSLWRKSSNSACSNTRPRTDGQISRRKVDRLTDVHMLRFYCVKNRKPRSQPRS